MRNAGVALVEVGLVVILTSPVLNKQDLPTASGTQPGWTQICRLEREGQALLCSTAVNRQADPGCSSSDCCGSQQASEVPGGLVKTQMPGLHLQRL